MNGAMAISDVAVMLPTSPEEAAQAFGDGAGVTVLAGGTIVVPDITYRRLLPDRVLMLARSGLDRITRENGVVTIGAAVPVSELEGGDEPLATAARHVADVEVRSQATLGGNLCAAPGRETPRGDLQAPLLVLDARARSAGAGGERVEPLEEFLAGDVRRRLLLDVSYDDAPRQTAYAAFWRPHTHHFTILAVAAARANGELRIAATGAAQHAVRLRTAEASGNPEDALADVDPQDDALASAWYRRKILPRLVEQALANLGEGGTA
jgi:carbon-monoxide dehydrogenase medium subunit